MPLQSERQHISMIEILPVGQVLATAIFPALALPGLLAWAPTLTLPL